MNRKRMPWLLIALLAVSLLAGCGRKYVEAEASMDRASAEIPMPEAAPMAAGDLGYGGGRTSAGPAPGADADAKIIYTADLDLESTDFDGAVSSLAALAEDCGGYFASSSLSNGGSYRSAGYTVRVPADRYREFLDRAGQTARLLNLYEYADDVSEEYYDAAGRLKTQQAKLDRLRELLAQAESMEDVIALESAISETEEQIDRLGGQLRWYDGRVDYATVNVSLREVSRLSHVPEPSQGFGSQMGAALRSGLAAFADRMGELLLALAYGWEWIALAGVGLAAALLLLRRALRRRRAKRAP